MRSSKSKKILIFWCLFIGLGAFLGGICMLIKPAGSILQMQDLLSYFKVLPFSEYLFNDYIFSGIMLIIVNGIPNVIASILMLKDKKSGTIIGTICGLLLVLWICIQFYVFPTNIMDILYFTFGLLQLLIGHITLIFMKQESFEFNKNDYKKINSNSDTLVVYFSRMNYTKKIAYSKANELEADILEIKTKEKVDGTLGFWWCGRFGLLNLNMPIEPINRYLSKYKKIIICSPIWVFNICSPIKTFIEKNKQYLNNCDLVLVHFNRMTYKNVFEKVEEKNNIKINKKITVCSQKGSIKYIKKIEEK